MAEPLVPDPAHSSGPHVPDTAQHAEQRTWVESVAQMIPGFGGYLNDDLVRQSNDLLRSWMVDRLREAKRPLGDYGQSLLSMGQIDGLPRIEKFEHRVDHLIARIDGAMQGYASALGLVRKREDRLRDVYDADRSIAEEIVKLRDEAAALKTSAAPPTATIPPLLEKLEEIDRNFTRRMDLMKGTE